jgi:hypothetical protein
MLIFFFFEGFEVKIQEVRNEVFDSFEKNQNLGVLLRNL